MPRTTHEPSGDYPKREAIHVLNVGADGEKLLAQLAGNRRQAKNLARESGVSLVLVAMQQGDEMEQHAAPGVVVVQVLEGNIALSADGSEVDLKQGQMVMLQPGVPHSHRAELQSLVLLTVTGAIDDE